MYRVLFLYAVLFLYSASFTAIAQPAALNSWRVYLPQTDATSLAYTADKVYVGTKFFLYEYNKTDGSINTLSSLNGFSELGIAQMTYNTNVNALLVAYNSSNFDVFRNGKVRNFPDINRSNITGEKTIYHLLPYGDKVYISCSFGIVLFNIVTEQFEDTYIIGANGTNIKVYQVATDDTNIVAATENGLYRADINHPNLAFFSSWEHLTTFMPEGMETKNIVYTNGLFYAEADGIIYQTTDLVDWNPIYGNSNWCIQSVEVSYNQVVICEWENGCNAIDQQKGRVVVINADQSIQQYEKWNLLRPIKAYTDESGNVWAADYWRSLIKMGTEYSETISPEGPYSSNVFSCSVLNNDVWVAHGGINYSNWNAKTSTEGYSVYSQGFWEGFGDRNTPALVDVDDILNIVKYPSQSTYYISSYNKGIITVNGTEFGRLDPSNSSLQYTVGDQTTCRIGGMTFDATGNLWVANFGTPNALSVMNTEGEWQSFTTPFIPGAPPNPFTQILVDDYNQKWVVAHKNGLLVFNHGTDFENITDDSYKLLKSGTNEGNLPVTEVNCLAKDKNGAIWVGTTKGIAVYYCPFSVFQNGCDAVRPYVDVTGFGAYLLETEVIRAIVVDGANRKWIGTENGLWLISPDGTEPLQYFTTKNSPLLSNFITSLSLNGESGELYIGTDRGLVSYRTDATDGGFTNGNLMVYPNPVRPEYEGEIAIKGAAENANVKITDIAGNLVFETIANGGTAVWSGRDYTGKKAASGVYLVFSSNSDGSDNAVTKFMIVR